MEMYTKVMTAAVAKQDYTMITRLNGTPNQDLVAAEAKYHRQKGCIRIYTRPNKVTEPVIPVHQQISHILWEEIKDEVIANKQLYDMSELLRRFCEIAKDMTDDSDLGLSYTKQKLKRQLMNECGDLSFIPQRGGRPELLCSNAITIGEALVKAHQISSPDQMDAADIDDTDTQPMLTRH